MVDKLCYSQFNNSAEMERFLDEPDEYWKDKRRGDFVKFVDWVAKQIWYLVADYWDVL